MPEGWDHALPHHSMDTQWQKDTLFFKRFHKKRREAFGKHIIELNKKIVKLQLLEFTI